MYTKINLSMPESQKNKISSAIKNSSPIKFTLKKEDTESGGPDAVHLTASQIKKLENGFAKNKPVLITMSASQVTHNRKIEGGGIFSALAKFAIPLIKSLLPAAKTAAKIALPALATGAIGAVGNKLARKAIGNGIGNGVGNGIGNGVGTPCVGKGFWLKSGRGIVSPTVGKGFWLKSGRGVVGRHNGKYTRVNREDDGTVTISNYPEGRKLKISEDDMLVHDPSGSLKFVDGKGFLDFLKHIPVFGPLLNAAVSAIMPGVSGKGFWLKSGRGFVSPTVANGYFKNGRSIVGQSVGGKCCSCRRKDNGSYNFAQCPKGKTLGISDNDVLVHDPDDKMKFVSGKGFLDFLGKIPFLGPIIKTVLPAIIPQTKILF